MFGYVGKLWKKADISYLNRYVTVNNVKICMGIVCITDIIVMVLIILGQEKKTVSADPVPY